MDDLWSRIQAQNDEMDRMNAERDRTSFAVQRLAEHDSYAQNYAASPPKRGPGMARAFNKGGASVVQHDSKAVGLSSAALAAQEKELDRQLELERSLSRGAQQGRAEQQQRGKPGAGRLTHAKDNAAQKENRGKIPLLPSRSGAPPSTSAGSVAPGGGRPRPARSEAGSVAPSVAGSMAPSLRQARPVHFTHRMADKQQVDSGRTGQMDHFLNPTDGIRGQMRRAGVEPKNHIRENRQLLKEMADVKQQHQMAKEEEEEARKASKEDLRQASRYRAQQKLHELGAIDLSEGEFFDGGSANHPSRGASAGRRSVRPPPTGQEPPPAPARAHEPGKMPAYLQRRKAEWRAEADEKAARAAADAECPPGTRLVGADEKAMILEKLAEERAKAQVELRSMPFVIKTQASQQKKDRLEARLEEIAGAEEAYMRDKVFVPADM